jgi:hypothetical protein
MCTLVDNASLYGPAGIDQRKIAALLEGLAENGVPFELLDKIGLALRP